MLLKLVMLTLSYYQDGAKLVPLSLQYKKLKRAVIAEKRTFLGVHEPARLDNHHLKEVWECCPVIQSLLANTANQIPSMTKECAYVWNFSVSFWCDMHCPASLPNSMTINPHSKLLTSQ